MSSPRVGLACAIVGLAALAPAALATTMRPPPPVDFSSRITHGPLVAGHTVTFAYRIESDDAFTLTLTRQQSALRVVRAGSSPYRLVSGRASWTRSLPGRVLVSRSVLIRVRIDAAWAGRTVCLRLEERLTYGGVPDVFEKRSCGTVVRR